jgi:hypothetical protein
VFFWQYHVNGVGDQRNQERSRCRFDRFGVLADEREVEGVVGDQVRALGRAEVHDGELGVGVPVAQRRESFWEQGETRCGERSEAQAVAVLVEVVGCVFTRAAERAVDLVGVVDQFQPERGEPAALGASFDELRADFLLQPGELLGNGRWRPSCVPRDASDAAVIAQLCQK